MELLCIAFDGNPRGYVNVSGRVPNMRQLAAIVGGPGEKDVTKLLLELEDANVFSRSEDGTIFSRRMVKDKTVFDEAVRIGKTGGNPNLKRKGKRGEIRGGVNPPHNRTVNGGSNHQEAEAEAEAEAESRSPPCPPIFDLPDVRWEEAEGSWRAITSGWYLDHAWERVALAARIDAGRFRSDLRPLVGWLASDIEPDTIVAAVERVSARAGYTPPFTLAFFDGAVREQRKAAA